MDPRFESTLVQMNESIKLSYKKRVAKILMVDPAQERARHVDKPACPCRVCYWARTRPVAP